MTTQTVIATLILIIMAIAGISSCVLYLSKEVTDNRLPANIKELWLTKIIRSCKTYEQLEVCENLVNKFELEYLDNVDISTRITRLQMELQYQRVFKIQVFNHVH